MSIFQLPRSAKWKSVCLFTGIISLSLQAFAQVSISGKVADSKGTGLPSMSVQIKNTRYGTASNESGNYNLTSDLKPGRYTIVFSGTGYKQKETPLTVTALSNYTVSTQMTDDILNLDEVVVTGNAENTTKRQLGTSVNTVSSAQLEKSGSTNILGALQGKVAGAQISQNSGDPGGSISVRLRGSSTLSGSSEPLYIIDGVIVSNATTSVTNIADAYAGSGTLGQNRLVDINPNDIERIEVINGSAAAAQYGSRASNGVVQIFTKKGKSGKPQVTVSTSFNINQLRKKVPVNLYSKRFEDAAVYQENKSLYDAYDYDQINLLHPYSRLTVYLNPALTNTEDFKRYDYQDNIFHTGIGSSNYVSVSGGQNESSYFFSGSYLYNQGIVRNTDIQKYSLKGRIDQRLNKWLRMNAGLNYIYSNTNEKPDGNSFFSPVNSINITDNIYDITKKDALGRYQSVENIRVNPNTIIYDIKQSQNTSRIIGDVQLHANPLKDLSVDYVLGTDNYTQSGQTFIPRYPYPNVNPDYYNDGYASAATFISYFINNDISATYAKQINSDLKSTTQVGFNHQYTRTRFTNAQGRDLSPFVQTVQGAANTAYFGPPVDSRAQQILYGYFIQQSLGFKNFAYLTGGLREDGSTVFDVNNRNNLYAKVSGSLVLSNTGFWNHSGLAKAFSSFKLRAAYGQAGNLTAIGPYDRFTEYSTSSYLGLSAAYPSAQLGNKNIKVERQDETEIGADMAVLNGRLGLNITYYSKKVKDLIVDRQVAPSSSFTSELANLANMTNRGFEFLLQATPVKTKNVLWSASLNFNHNKNKVIDNGSGSANAVVYIDGVMNQTGAPVAIINGQSLGVFYGSYYARDNNGNLLLTPAGLPQRELGDAVKGSQRDANGQPTGSVLQKVIGDPNPKYTASFANDISYKKFSLHFQLDDVHGFQVFNADKRTRQGVGIGEIAEQEIKGELKRGYVRAIYPIQEFRIDDGSFIKIREAGFNYDIGKSKIFSDISIAVTGRNLVSFDHFNGYDPETNSAGAANVARSVNFGNVPAPRSFEFSLNAKF